MVPPTTEGFFCSGGVVSPLLNPHPGLAISLLSQAKVKVSFHFCSALPQPCPRIPAKQKGSGTPARKKRGGDPGTLCKRNIFFFFFFCRVIGASFWWLEVSKLTRVIFEIQGGDGVRISNREVRVWSLHGRSPMDKDFAKDSRAPSRS